MFKKVAQQGRSEAHAARNNEQHVRARRRVGEPAVSWGKAYSLQYADGQSDARTKLGAFFNILLIIGLMTLASACAQTMEPGVTGFYQTWDDVINRWVGKNKKDLYYELGPPNLHPHTSADGMEEMGWDFTIDRMPGQADEYNLLPMYGGGVNCRLIFIADKNDVIREGKRIGCD